MSLLAAAALLRAHVLVVELPGLPLLRLRAEAAVRARGWLVVTDPGTADVLLVCGAPGAALAEAIDGLWDQVPAPRTRCVVVAADELAAALDGAAQALADRAAHRAAAASAAPAAAPDPGRFGPFLPDWPGGLVVDCATSPDGRIAAVGVRRLPASGEDEAHPHRALLLAAADAARLLRLAGWEPLATRLDRVVDLALAGTAPERLRGRLRAVARRVRRSTALRWALAGRAPEVAAHERLLVLLAAAADGVPPPAAPLRPIGHRPAAVPLLVAAAAGPPADG